MHFAVCLWHILNAGLENSVDTKEDLEAVHFLLESSITLGEIRQSSIKFLDYQQILCKTWTSSGGRGEVVFQELTLAHCRSSINISLIK